MKLLALTLSLTIATFATSAGQSKLALKQYFKNEFTLGVAVSEDQIMGKTSTATEIFSRHFNSITAENVMKWESIHPSPDKYNFVPADAMIKLAENNDAEVIGHTLVWHSQTPDWVFTDESGTPVSKQTLIATMKAHIFEVAGRYKGRVDGWDVVNEALNEDGTLRDSKWRQIVGDEYIELAFQFAHEAAPAAKLYYNDYNLFKPEKRQGVLKLIERLKKAGIPIHGIGIQGHYALDYPDLNQLEDSIEAFASQGVEVMITELDVSVLPFPDEENMGADVSLNLALNNEMNPYSDGLPVAIAKQTADRYAALFALFRRHSDSLSRITFWGVTDKQSWRNDWPMKGRADYPLWFDRNGKLKPFVKEIVISGH